MGLRNIIVSCLAILGALFLITVGLDMPLGNSNFWHYHGIFFLVFIAFFPRLTLLLSGVAWGGLFWWLGLIFAPRFLVAFLATLHYWKQNPILVLISWLVAIGGEGSEKYYVVRRGRSRRGPPPPPPPPGASSSGGEGFDNAKWVN